MLYAKIQPQSSACSGEKVLLSLFTIYGHARVTLFDGVEIFEQIVNILSTDGRKRFQRRRH